MHRKTIILTLALTLALAAGASAQTALVQKMGLSELADNAENIHRVTVLAVEPGTVALGGTELPTVTYRLRVEDTFKGEYAGKQGDDETLVELTMLGTVKADAPNGTLQRLSHLPALPELAVGGTYVLFTTEPSAAGLSTTVGLSQGSFKVWQSPDKQELVANDLNNLGIFEGPVTYATLAGAIHDELGN
ncbi:MAG TPA: hypothetical protein VHQ65_01645 [Thermoanaerobaculia bacterium]|nr:hypothetical protein [Thermoanaerobaculia bacterium]